VADEGVLAELAVLCFTGAHNWSGFTVVSTGAIVAVAALAVSTLVSATAGAAADLKEKSSFVGGWQVASLQAI